MNRETGTMGVVDFTFSEDDLIFDDAELGAEVEVNVDDGVESPEPIAVKNDELEEVESTEEVANGDETTTVDVGEGEEEPDDNVHEYNTTDKSDNPYDNLKEQFLKDGTWQNALLEIDGEEVELSELKEITPELFDSIHAEQRKLATEDTTDKFFSKEDFSEMHLNMIALMKAGAETKQIQQALRYKEEVIDPLESYDLSNESHQEQLVSHILRENNKGMSPQAIAYQIDLLKQDNALSTTAQNYADQIKKSYNKALQDRTKSLQEEIATKNKAHSELTDKVLQVLETRKTKKGVRDTINRFYRSDTQDQQIVKEINKLKEDPEKLAKLLLFLTDEKEYNEVYNVSPNIREASQVLTRLSLAPIKTPKKTKVSKVQKDIDTELAKALGF